MADNETTADIIAAMRFDATTRDQFDSAYIVDFCDRLEAAHRREAGDCAKLREAIENSNGLLEELAAIGEWGESALAQIAENNAALAAPPRNCDKVKTSWDVLKKWHEGLDTANDIVRMLDWLFAPATEKEGGAK